MIEGASQDTIDIAIARKKLLIQTIQNMLDNIEDYKREIKVLDEIIDIKSTERRDK